MTSTTTLILMLYFIQGSVGSEAHTSGDPVALHQSPTVGIAGGRPVVIEAAPFMASLFKVFADDTNITSYWCGGSIVHERFVLTAATCIDDRLVVRVGSPYSDEGKLHQVDKYITHESFSYETFNNDVALLKLTEPVTFGPSVAVIKLADDSVSITAGLTANVTGWGETEDGLLSRQLQRVSVTVSPLGACDQFYDTYGIKLTDKQICVSNEGKGFCTFDRGGPLTLGDLQIGIESLGSACGDLIPNVYQRVAPHLLWIQNTINQNL